MKRHLASRVDDRVARVRRDMIGSNQRMTFRHIGLVLVALNTGLRRGHPRGVFHERIQPDLDVFCILYRASGMGYGLNVGAFHFVIGPMSFGLECVQRGRGGSRLGTPL
jgi:hypothetical protein